MGIKSLLPTIAFVTCLSISACGDTKANDNSTNLAPVVPATPAVSTLQTFDFTATVDQILGTPTFSVAIGDKLTGKFVYDTTAQDWNIANINQGYFHHMNSPSGVQFQIGTLNFVSALDTYYIAIQNDDSSALPTRDEFEIRAKSSQDSKLTTILNFRDFTATAFSSSTCNLLPQTLDINSFTNNYIFVNYSNPGSNLWSIRLLPTALTKE